MSETSSQTGALVEAAHAVLAALGERELTVGVAESLTGGQVCSTLVAVPGASAVVVGGVVAYSTRIKTELLEVDAQYLQRSGPVDAQVAMQMARGVAGLMGSDLGLATTGVAGPGASDGHPAGSVHVAVSSPWGVVSRELRLDGGRQEVRDGATAAVLALALGVIEASGAS